MRKTCQTDLHAETWIAAIKRIAVVNIFAAALLGIVSRPCRRRYELECKIPNNDLGRLFDH